MKVYGSKEPPSFVLRDAAKAIFAQLTHTPLTPEANCASILPAQAQGMCEGCSTRAFALQVSFYTSRRVTWVSEVWGTHGDDGT
eukprot:3420959-Amphidinium_carterae.1